MSLRDKILNAAPKVRPVPVPGWDCTVYVHAMTARERADYQTTLRATKRAAEEAGDDAGNDAVGLLVARCARDEHGVRIFTDADAARLMDTDGAAVELVMSVAAELNGMDAKTEDAAEKKPGAPGGASGCDSPGSAGTPTPTTC